MSAPFIYLKLDTERKFRFSNRALYIFETTTGRKMSEMDLNKLGIVELNQMIYAGLKSQDESITLEQVIDLIDEYGDIDELGEKLELACENSSFLQSKSSKQAEKKKKN